MKETSEDFKPRRDGWYEHVGTWGEVTKGTMLADPESRTKVWEVIDTAHGPGQIEYGRTLWMRIREVGSGEEHTVKPRMKTTKARILTRDPLDTKGLPPSEPSDTEAIQLLVKELGAEVLATRDNETGEITCPNYAAGGMHPGGSHGDMRGELEHLRFAHGVDTTFLEEMHWEDRIRETTTFHGRAHMRKYPDVGKGGFPHRHVPEDLSMFG